MTERLTWFVAGLTDDPALGGVAGGILPLLGWNHGVSQWQRARDLASGAPPGATHNDFTLSRFVDRLTPALHGHCSKGRIFPEAVVEIEYRDGAKLRFRFRDVLISSAFVTGCQGGQPTESVALNYDRIEWEYQRANAGGAVKTAWSAKEAPGR